MPHHRRRSSGLGGHDTGFPEQFVGTTHRHPESRLLTAPWEPKEVDMVRLARQISMTRQQSRQARQFGLDSDEDDDGDFGFSHPPRTRVRRPSLPGPKGSSGWVRTSHAVPVIPMGNTSLWPVSAEESPSPTTISFAMGDDSGRHASLNERKEGNFPELGGNNGAADDPIGRSRSHSHTSTGESEYTAWVSSQQTYISPRDRSGWGSWSARFLDWKKHRSQRSRSSSLRE